MIACSHRQRAARPLSAGETMLRPYRRTVKFPSWMLPTSFAPGTGDMTEADDAQRPHQSEPADDLVLARRIVSGDRHALEIAYDQYGDLVFRVAFWLTKTETEAEDVLQEVFLRLPSLLHTFDGHGTLGGWLRRVAMRTVLMDERRRKRHAEIAEPGFGAMRPRAEPVDVITRITLEDAIRRLPDHQRLVFVLKEVHGHTHAQIAELLGISEHASRVRLFRARQALRKQVSQP